MAAQGGTGYYTWADGAAAESRDHCEADGPRSLRSTPRVGTNDPHTEDGGRRSGVGGFEADRHLLLIRDQIRRNQILHIEETNFLFGTAAKSRLLAHFLAVDENVASARPTVLIAVSHDQGERMGRIHGQIERE